MTATQAPTPGPLSGDDEMLYARAIVFATRDKPSTSYLQRRLQIGFNLAASLIERMENEGLISKANSAGKRTILVPFSAPTAPVEASGSEREADAWKWLGQLYPNDAPSDLAYDANEMVDAFLAGSGRSDRMAKALERIADEQQYRSGYCQTDITVEPALTAEEAQTVAREALAQQTAPRPQPSGETREQCAACSRGEVTHFSTDDGFWVEITTSAGGANEHGLNGWFETLEHYPDGSTRRREYVATDSPSARPAPVASGCQHSSGEVAETAGEASFGQTGKALYDAFWSRNGGNAPAWEDQSRAIRIMWMNIARDAASIRPVDWDAVEFTEGDGSGPFLEVIPDRNVEGCYRTVVHASPVPAQDDDKLRIAVEALEDISAGFVGPSVNQVGHLSRLKERADEALAALKAEGK